MKKQFIACIPPVLIEIRASRMLPGQIGLFAVRSLKQGTVIARNEWLGERFLQWNCYRALDRKTKAHVRKFCLQTDTGFHAPRDFNRLIVPWHINHSCAYNVGFDKPANFVTARAVRADEELCWDYGMAMSYERFRLRCACGSPVCRKVITGNDWKNPAFVEKNRGYFLRELLRKADKRNKLVVRKAP